MDRIAIMRLFVRIVERGSFTAAAVDLGLPRATATTAIQHLERDLGVRLLDRTTRSVGATPEGRLYRDRCIQLLADLDDTETLFRASEPRGPLRVDLQSTLARRFVMPALPDFVARYPDIALSISEGDRIVDLIPEGVDCVLRVGDLPDSGLVGRKVASLNQITLASPAYLAHHGEPRTPDDLEGHLMVGYTASATGKPYPLKFGAGQQYREILLPFQIKARGAENYSAAGLAGLGLIQIPHSWVVQEIAAGAFIPVITTAPPPALPVFILYPQNRYLASRLRVFIDWITEVFRPLNGPNAR
ncbi:LysR family transcriptional regulator [Sphingobium sp. CR2-8]|uniref:LysR family transcriptional regulator n=1 Tax=Sphingobium sp. CR2-8 TaxID=1306534 RepID=UPI002DB8908D|nr:LysR family transcriptional regulator [Sphingobium sp. CR2-8]MEC3909565.1 LysR family transcriptional regulator [Sphingobium sp. CR2-8]